MREEYAVIDRLRSENMLSFEDFALLLTTNETEAISYLHSQAREAADAVYGRRIFARGLIEFTNYCKNDCYYCGIRRSNSALSRYRLTKEEILDCCKTGAELGFHTFVLQGGEDLFFTDEKICDMIAAMKQRYPDCAVTLSVGEKERESYAAYRRAGADRYLLREETADEGHYETLHPAEMSLAHRKECLRTLQDLGYQTGAGFLVGTPGQTLEHLYADICFLRALQPAMAGIGPFLPQKDTPFAKETPGSPERTLRLLSIVRLLLPGVLLPATTALATIHPEGREQGILAGANVVMPNLSPKNVRGLYNLYDGKRASGSEAAEGLAELKQRIEKIGFVLDMGRGDALG